MNTCKVTAASKYGMEIKKTTTYDERPTDRLEGNKSGGGGLYTTEKNACNRINYYEEKTKVPELQKKKMPEWFQNSHHDSKKKILYPLKGKTRRGIKPIVR